MGTHLRTTGVSRRAYARMRGCSEGAVRKAIADGRLRGAVLPDGSIDAAKADAILAKTTIAPPVAPADLSEARVRKLRAQCALLRDDVKAAEAEFVPQAEIAIVRASVRERMEEFLGRMFADIAPAAAGCTSPMEIGAAVQRVVHGTLTALAATKVVREGGDDPAGDDIVLGELDARDLAALKATLQARRLEIRREARSGSMVRLADVSREMVARFTAVRAFCLALPSRLAPLLAMSDAPTTQRHLDRALVEAMGHLDLG